MSPQQVRVKLGCFSRAYSHKWARVALEKSVIKRSVEESLHLVHVRFPIDFRIFVMVVRLCEHVCVYVCVCLCVCVSWCASPA